jgi:CHAT domain
MALQALNIGWYRLSDPDHSGLVFAPLAGAADEAKALQELLKLDTLTGANATEEKLEGLHGPHILYVTTHSGSG